MIELWRSVGLGFRAHALLTAAVGIATGSIDAALLQALPSRLVALLEHDLLQAVALYAFVGALLRHVNVAGRVVDGFMLGLRRAGVPTRPRPVLAGFGVSALTAPMNGSGGAGVTMLSHVVAPCWRRSGIGAPAATVTATLGVVMPPSLVLLLLGDAMVRAHTEGLTQAGTTGVRVIDTQDLTQACTPVAAMLTLAWGATCMWCARTPPDLTDTPSAALGNDEHLDL